MFYFANKTDLIIDQGMAVDMATATNKTTTPSAIRRQLSDLARLSVLRGKWFVQIKGGATGSANVRLLAGGVELASVAFDGTEFTQTFEAVAVDLTDVGGVADLYTEAECIVTGAAVEVSSWLEIEHPLVISA